MGELAVWGDGVGCVARWNIAIKFAIKTGNSGDIEVMQHLWGSLPDLSLSNIFR